jgi:hypothetical protein
MKCIKKDGKVKRVSDEKAFELVHKEEWAFCPKHEWKDAGRK